jgi:hypothetical protein
MSLVKDPDERRKKQWEKTAQAQRGWNCAKMLGFCTKFYSPQRMFFQFFFFFFFFFFSVFLDFSIFYKIFLICLFAIFIG